VSWCTVDVKKLGKVPPGGGHRIHGRSIGKQHSGLARRLRKSTAASGYHYLHTALDDHSRWPTPKSTPTSKPPPQPRSGAVR
jgi:hypothetical protein